MNKHIRKAEEARRLAAKIQAQEKSAVRPQCPECGEPCLWDEGEFGDRNQPMILGAWHCGQCGIDVDGPPPVKIQAQENAMTQETKHTPGPWGRNRGRVWGKNSAKATVLIAHVSGEPGDREAEANARLIVAAPDLLAALQLALRYLEHPDVQAMPFALPASAAAKSVSDAIAKAEGGV